MERSPENQPEEADKGNDIEATFDVLRKTIGPHLDKMTDQELIYLYGPGILGLPDDQDNWFD